MRGPYGKQKSEPAPQSRGIGCRRGVAHAALLDSPFSARSRGRARRRARHSSLLLRETGNRLHPPSFESQVCTREEFHFLTVFWRESGAPSERDWNKRLFRRNAPVVALLRVPRPLYLVYLSMRSVRTMWRDREGEHGTRSECRTGKTESAAE